MQIPAIIEYVPFRSDGFAILSCSLNAFSSKYNPELEDLLASKVKKNKYDTFTITVSSVRTDERLEGRQCVFDGDFTTHPKYGAQFKAEMFYQDEPNTEEGLQAYLMELPNIKEVRSREIIKKFGLQGTIDILNDDPYKLIAINGLNEKRIKPIKDAWDRDKAKREFFIWLCGYGVPIKVGNSAYELWGNDSQNIISENPYRLTEIRGLGFVIADQMAHKILDEVPEEYRMFSCIRYTLSENTNKNSNLCMPLTCLKNEVKDILKKCDEAERKTTNITTYNPLIGKTIKANLDKFVAVKEMNDAPVTYIYLKEIWEKEKFIATQLNDRSLHDKNKSLCTETDISDAEEDLQKITGRKITLDDCQKEAVKSAFNHKITVITGGGGTGKSTICRCIYHLAQEKGQSIRMMSPTGKAAQVLSDKTKGNASTIHRSLKMLPGEDFGREDVTEDIIIIDEFSMVGIDTLFALLASMEENLWANIILVGDSNQLPSVSAGNFLKDIISSKSANVVRLDQIHRQDEKSYISIVADQIANGKVTEIPEDAVDIKWIDINPNEFSAKIPNIVKKFMEKKDIRDLQLMAPMYNGPCGVNKINEEVQKMMASFNGTEENILKRGFNSFYVGDRVIQTSNDYDKQIFNGDMGVIVDLGTKILDPSVSDQKVEFVIVEFYGNEIMLVGKEIEQLKLAWCITVHKFQGSQSPFIIFVMASEAEIMMSKELVYTAFTRAEKFLCIYGNKNMLRVAPHKSIVKKRYTNLVNLIMETRDNRKVLKVTDEK